MLCGYWKKGLHAVSKQDWDLDVASDLETRISNPRSIGSAKTKHETDGMVDQQFGEYDENGQSSVYRGTEKYH